MINIKDDSDKTFRIVVLLTGLETISSYGGNMKTDHNPILWATGASFFGSIRKSSSQLSELGEGDHHVHKFLQASIKSVKSPSRRN